MYGHFQGLNAGMRSLCLLLALPTLKRLVSIADTTLMMLGMCSGMASLIVFGSSTNTDTVYLGKYLMVVPWAMWTLLAQAPILTNCV